MGSTTSNISIYIPAAGETNYDSSFAAGMQNIDQHDHSGGPTGGVPISTTGLADGSVTYSKLAANVVDTTTGIGVSGTLPNQLSILGLLKNIYQLATTAGFIVKNGAGALVRTITGTANQITVTNGDGVAGDPVISLPATIYTNINFGNSTLDSYRTNTFTPALSIGGSTAGLSYTSRVGKYWRVGSVVFVNIDIVMSSIGANTGVISISGLPFASANDGQENVFVNNSFIPLFTVGPDAYTYLTGELAPNTSEIKLVGVGQNKRGQLTQAFIDNTSQFQLSGFYWVS